MFPGISQKPFDFWHGFKFFHTSIYTSTKIQKTLQLGNYLYRNTNIKIPPSATLSLLLIGIKCPPIKQRLLIKATVLLTAALLSHKRKIED